MANNKKNVIIRIQDWIESSAGQTFLNYAYSWGAAVVILGALFKLTHISGANAMLFIGMGTEVLVFFISGFDRPAELKEDEQLKRLAEEGNRVAGVNPQPDVQPVVMEAPVVINPVVNPVNVAASPAPASGAVNVSSADVQPVNVAGMPTADIKALADMVNAANVELFEKVLEDARNSSTPEMKEAAEAYVEELKTLTETLARVSDQAEHMTRDSKEMDNLNRTLTGINTIYEMQLKSISTQVGTIDQINEQTRKMARQIEELNGIYNRMIQALTVNMKHAPGSSMAE